MKLPQLAADCIKRDVKKYNSPIHIYFSVLKPHLRTTRYYFIQPPRRRSARRHSILQYRQPQSPTMPTSNDLTISSTRREGGMTTMEEDHYLNALNEFIRRCDQELVMLEWIRTRCPNILNLLPISRTSPDNPVRVIGVGCGNGIMDAQILREVFSWSTFVEEVAIEPNEAELLRFKERIEGDDRLRALHFDWIQTTTEVFEKTMKQLTADGAFPKVHLVHMLQMLYHTCDMETTISNYYKMLHVGGVLLITIASKKNNDLYKSFLDLEPKRCKQTTKNKKRYSEDVTRVLRRMGLNYDLENVIYHLDITECFKADSKGGMLLLDFICLTNAAQVYQTLTTSDRERLMKRLMDHCEQHDDGRVTVRLSFDALIVRKGGDGCSDQNELAHAQSVAAEGAKIGSTQDVQ